MGLVDDLRDEAGSALRTVAFVEFGSGEYDVRYMRPDIGEQYTEEEIEEIYQDIGVAALSKQFDSDLYNSLGESEGVIGIFEDGHNVIRWNEDGSQALFVGLGADLDAATRVFENTTDVFSQRTARQERRVRESRERTTD